MEQIIISQATTDDINEISSLMCQLFELEKGVTINQSNQIAGIKMLINNKLSMIVTAKINDKIIGICSVQTMISTAEGGYSAWIEDMIVNSNYRKYGVGSKIINFVEKWAKEKNYKRIQLLCDEDNIKGQKFYKKHCFQKTTWLCWQKKL